MIRQFQPEDAPSCWALIRACLEADPSLPASLRHKIQADETPQSIKDCANLYYVAVYESENRILGLVGLDMNEIRLLFVSPHHQRRGIGRMLFEHIQPMVPSALFKEIFVYSSLGAVGFYRSCGFTDKGPFPFELNGERLETVFMTSPIPRTLNTTNL